MAGLALSRQSNESRAPRPELDPDILAKIKPVTLAGQRTVPVPEALSPLFPWGGLPRGSDVVVKGPGSWSLAMAMWAAALGDEGWLAIVGLPDLSLVAAGELGVRLDRVLVVDTPGAGQWATVVAPLLEAVDIVKRRDASGNVETVGRSDLGAAQVPMAFGRAVLDSAHAQRHRLAASPNGPVEDSQLLEALGWAVASVPGEVANVHLVDEASLAVIRACCDIGHSN